MKTAIVIGASRGLGLGLTREFLDRGWTVVATTRGRHDAALAELAAERGDALRLETLDMTDEPGIAAFARALGDLRPDVLFVSAGTSGDTGKPIGAVDTETFAHIMGTNALAPLKVIETIGGRVADTGAIVAMTSVLGSVDGNRDGGYELYRASKAALNSLLRSYAARHKDRSIVAMHPGWVRTDMGGDEAPLGVGESAAGIVDVVETRLGQAGCVFLDHRGETIAW